MSFTTLPQSTLPENLPTRLATHPSGYIPHLQHPRHPQHSGHGRPSPYPALPRHLPTDFGLRNSWAVEFDPDRAGHPHPIRSGVLPIEPLRRSAPRTEAEYAARLQEIAWSRFLRKTADLAACHVRQAKPPLMVRLASAIKRAVATITRSRSRALPTATS